MTLSRSASSVFQNTTGKDVHSDGSAETHRRCDMSPQKLFRSTKNDLFRPNHLTKWYIMKIFLAWRNSPLCMKDARKHTPWQRRPWLVSIAFGGTPGASWAFGHQFFPLLSYSALFIRSRSVSHRNGMHPSHTMLIYLCCIWTLVRDMCYNYKLLVGWRTMCLF